MNLQAMMAIQVKQASSLLPSPAEAVCVSILDALFVFELDVMLLQQEAPPHESPVFIPHLAKPRQGFVV